MQIDLSGLHSVPHLDQYTGLWAVSPSHFLAEFEAVSRMNLHAHVAEHAPEAAARKPRMSAAEDGRIAIVELRGTLTKFGSSLGGAGSTIEARRQIVNAARSGDVDGILIVIDSPGGSVSGTADLADDVREAAKAKPVFAVAEDMAASAAYWVGSQATRFFANQGTANVGSIGTFIGLYDLSGLAANERIKPVVIKSGEFKGAGFPGTEITDEFKAHLQEIVDGSQAEFDQAVSRGRGLDLTAVRELADGRIFQAKQAVKLGLIDGVQRVEHAMVLLRKEARSQKGVRMSGEGSPPKAATLKELRAGCPGADEKFLVSQLEREATLAQAQVAWMEEQNARHEALQKAKDEADAKALADAEKAKAEREEAEKKANRPGVDPVRETGAKTDSDAEPVADWNTAINEKVAAGMTRAKAVSAVARSRPELRAALVEHANAGRRAAG